MTIRAIFAADNNWGIGKNNDLPWPHNSEDLKWFKDSTDGDVVVMGRKTWESLPRKPLSNRVNYVITSDPNIEEGYHGRFSSKNIGRAILAIIQERFTSEPDIWIIGGAQLLKGCLPIIEEVWVSRIQGAFDCDTFIEIDTQHFYLSTSETFGGLLIEKYRKK